MPQIRVDVAGIGSRLGRLADAAPCPHCGAVTTAALADMAALLAEVSRLYAALLAARRESADHLAAIRAALGAAADGDADPLSFLRDELAEPHTAPLPIRGEGWCG